MEVLVGGRVCSEGLGGAGGLCRTPPVFVGRQQRGCLGKGQGTSCGPGDRTVIVSSSGGPLGPSLPGRSVGEAVELAHGPLLRDHVSGQVPALPGTGGGRSPSPVSSTAARPSGRTWRACA